MTDVPTDVPADVVGDDDVTEVDTDAARQRGPSGDRAALFATIATAVAALVLVVVAILAVTGSGDAGEPDGGDDGTEQVLTDDGATADPEATVDQIVPAAAIAMGEVDSVEFRLDRSGAPVYIDQFESIALDDLIGQFTVPNQAQAQLTVTVDGNLATRIGAVALDDEVWISNPVTGDFETLPEGYDIDPSRFFDPQDGWRPLIENLADVELLGIDDRGGERYHVRGTAPAEQVRDITVDLVRDQDVEVELWIHPTTSLVTAAEFDTVIDGDRSSWELWLDRYGADFTIEPPENVRD